MSLLPSAGEGGRRPDEGAASLSEAQPSPARLPLAGPERPLPRLGRGDNTMPFSPAREKVAAGRMRGLRPCQRLSPHPLGSRWRDPSDLSRGRER